MQEPIFDQNGIAELFDRWATDPSLQPDEKDIPHLAGLAALEALELTSSDVLLDLGCGVGRFSLAAARVCEKVIGYDVSPRSIDRATELAEEAGLINTEFRQGSFADRGLEPDLKSISASKALLIYSLHHLPDSGKADALAFIAGILTCPARIVIADLTFFDDKSENEPRLCREARCDGGQTDIPARAEEMRGWLETLGAAVRVEKLHPLVGLFTADWY